MRPSANRHVLAVLRRELGGIQQHRLATRVGCSVETIRKIEKGKLKLSEYLAMKIENETGVAMRWLLQNDVSVPPITPEGSPYSIKEYDKWRAQKRDHVQAGIAILQKTNLPGFLFSTYETLRHIFVDAIDKDNQRLALYRLSKLLEEFREEITGEQLPFVPRYTKKTLALVESDLESTKGLVRVVDSKFSELGRLLIDYYAEE